MDPTRKRIVEGEPGIFPAPVASVLRAFGRLFRREKPPEDVQPEDEGKGKDSGPDA